MSFPSADDRAVSAFVDSDCVVATGSDQAIAAIARASRPGTRLVGYGHRCSVAVIGPEATDRTTAQALATALAQDVALWDQLGCLSPIAVLCLGGNPKQLARELADALRGCAERMPRGVLPAAAAAAIRSERDAAALRRAAGADVEVEGDEALSYTVVREPDAALRPSPLHRFVRVHPVEGLASLREVLSPLSQHLAGVAIAGFGAGRQAVERELASLGASRVCAPGRLQAPPFGWHHDNQPVLLPLLRVTDLETPA